MPVPPPLLLYSEPETGELFRRRWMLAVVDGTDRGAVVEIHHSPVLIGAAPAAQLVITDDTVSRYHLEIDVFADGLRLRDLDSTNGTYVGDQRIRDAFIENGSEFRVGRTTIRPIAIDESAAPEIDTDPHGAPLGAIERLNQALGVAGVTRDLFRSVRRVATSISSVLLEGEPGTGKATLARILHASSSRRDHPFVAFAPRSEDDVAEIEASLFGLAGTRNGGGEPRQSLFELARGGTLFIEEIEELPATLHLPLLRTIESGEIQRPGEERRIRVNARLVASSAIELRTHAGFDPALYRRIATVHLRVPPLRARSEDIGPLAEHFLERASGKKATLGKSVVALLRSHGWPGNLDQLRAAVESLRRPLEPDDEIEHSLRGDEAIFEESLKSVFIADAVARHAGHVSKAATELATSPRELFRYLSRRDVDLDRL